MDQWSRRAWGLAVIALCVWTVWKVGGFDLTVTLPSGQTIPNTYSTVDHPFHASRAAQLLDSLRDGEILRWMSSHQGGYPVEFYPLGIAWFEVILWAATGGAWSILAMHKLAVALVFVLPALAYWLLVRGDSIHPSAAFLATAFHIAIPGHWLNGGYEELVGWGLITNVAGGTLALLGMVLLARYVCYQQHWHGVASVIAIAAGAVCNPRSLFAIAIASVAILASQLLPADRGLRRRLTQALARIAIVGGLSFLISAPVIVALLRYSDLYFFLHYEFYDPLDKYWEALITAMTEPVIWLAIAGGIIALGGFRSFRATQAVTLAILFYTLFTVWIATSDTALSFFEQLEAPRLMPFQRLSMIGLAAIAIVAVLQFAVHRGSIFVREGVIGVVVIAISWWGISTHTDLNQEKPIHEIGLYPVGTVGEQQFSDLEAAITEADELRPQGSAIFVIGNKQEWWHEQLWAPGIAPGVYSYDDWMWYWHSTQPGPYNAMQGYFMPNPSDALTDDYLQQHGIGVVVVSDMWVQAGTPPREAAAHSELLELRVSHGVWDVYTVRDPGVLVTRGDQKAANIKQSNGRISADVEAGEGPILVRQNWFPRWIATANGEPVEITRGEDGYMLVHAPAGDVHIELHYGVTATDWAARAGSIVGIVGLVGFGWLGRRMFDVGSQADE